MYFIERVTHTVEPLGWVASDKLITTMEVLGVALTLLFVAAAAIALEKERFIKTIATLLSISVVGIVLTVCSIVLGSQKSSTLDEWHKEASRIAGEIFLPSDLKEVGLLQAMQAEEASTLTIPTAPQEGGKGVKVTVNGWGFTYDTPSTEGHTLSKEAQLMQIGETVCASEQKMFPSRVAQMCKHLEESAAKLDATQQE